MRRKRTIEDVERNGPFESYTAPYSTNAELNRDAAVRLFKAGWGAQDIADEFPEVFYASDDGEGRVTLGQWYDRLLSDGRGEADVTINREAVDALLGG